MSDNWIIVFPESAEFIPSVQSQQKAVELFRSMAPDADQIEALVTDHIRFLDCGANLERILCPKCEAEVEMEWWGSVMDEEAGAGFPLRPFVLSCCGSSESLATLRYDWPQGFARFSIEAMNPNIPDLTASQIEAFEIVLGCRVRKVLQHL